MTNAPDSLAAIEAACWRELGAAAAQRSHAWRVAALATVDAGVPQLRSVVLREVDATARELLFFTDARSPKVAQLHAQPRASLLCWSALLGWQLRMQVRLVLHTHGLQVSSRWARLKLTPAAQDYLSPLPPGTPLGAAPAAAPERAEREHFAVVQAQVLAMDWLELAPQGHRRAAFDGDGARWLTP